MIFLFIAIAFYIAWIWVEYYRLIDIYDTDRLIHFLICFLFGGASVELVFLMNDLLLNSLGMHLTGIWWKDFLYTTFKIGALEELAKFSGFGLFYLLFKRVITEPIDVLAYVATAALGFSAVENVLYFNKFGASIIDGRAVLSTVGHMFDTALIGYGLVIVKFVYQNQRKWVLLLYWLMASVAHGIYDFTLMYEPLGNAGIWILLIYFFVCIELFATMLNNAVNNSKYFTYTKVINPSSVALKLFGYYLVLFVIQDAVLLLDVSFSEALQKFGSTLLFTGIIITITIIRMSRFKLIPGRWSSLRLSLPFSIIAASPTSMYPMFVGLRIQINGESLDETMLNTLYHKHFELVPLSTNGRLKEAKHAFISEKFFLADDESFYQVDIWLDPNTDVTTSFIIKPKRHAKTQSMKREQIVWLLELKKDKKLLPGITSERDFNFVEWCTIRSII